MQRIFAISFAVVGMLCLAGCKPATYYPFGHKPGAQPSNTVNQTSTNQPPSVAVEAKQSGVGTQVNANQTANTSGQLRVNQVVPMGAAS